MIDKKEIDNSFAALFLNADGKIDSVKLSNLGSDLLHSLTKQFNILYGQKYLDEQFLEKLKSDLLKKIEVNFPDNRSYISTNYLVENGYCKLQKTFYSVGTGELLLDRKSDYNKMKLYDLTCLEQGYCQTKEGITRNNLKVFKHQAATAVYIQGLKEYMIKVGGNVVVTDKDMFEETEFLKCQDIFKYVITFVLKTMTEENKRKFIDFSQSINKLEAYYREMHQSVEPSNFINDVKVLKENGFKQDTLVFTDYDKQFLQGINLFCVVKQGKKATRAGFEKVCDFTVDGNTYDFYYNTATFSKRNAPTILNYIYLRDILMRLIVFLYPKKVKVDTNNVFNRGLSGYQLYTLGKDADANKLIGILNRVTLVTPCIKKVNFTTNSENYKYYYQVV